MNNTRKTGSSHLAQNGAEIETSKQINGLEDDEHIQMVPNISQKVLARALEVLVDQLQAVKLIKVGKDWVKVPDYAIRQKAARMLLAYGFDLPSARADSNSQ